MPLERAVDHPTYDFGGNTVTSLIAPSRGGIECVLYRVVSPPGQGLPPHRHDHLDTFTVTAGGGVWHLDGATFELTAGDSVIVTMLPGTTSSLDDGSELVPAWVS
jgi:quercetin dioxygenase-like cupin family protein